MRHVLVVDDDEAERRSIAALIGGEDVEVETAGSGEEALARLDEARFDCIVLDLKLPKASGFTLLERVKTDERHRDVPVIVHTGQGADAPRGDAPEALRRVDHRQGRRARRSGCSTRRRWRCTGRRSRCPPNGRRMLEQMRDADAALTGRRVLIVDDDVRNVFALTSALEAHGMEVVYAENGREALEPPARRRRTSTSS